MYNILSGCLNPNQITMIGILAAFLLTFICLKFPFPFLPVDQGREFAVNGALSKGKTRGVGLTFVIAFIICSLLFMPITARRYRCIIPYNYHKTIITVA